MKCTYVVSLPIGVAVQVDCAPRAAGARRSQQYVEIGPAQVGSLR
jgi:hypothetical protein